LPRPGQRATYRPGEFEYDLASLWFCTGSLGERTLAEAENLAREGNVRQQIRDLHRLRGEWQLSMGHWDEAKNAFEENIQMMREINLSAANSEARLALAQAKMGRTQVAREEAERLCELENPPNLALAELYVALGDLEKVRRHVLPAHKKAWADGEPYAYWWFLQRCRKVLQALGEPEPQLPKFDPANFPPLPYEAKVLEYIEKKALRK
jgi:tetratricopeptide (TPR) repeat protein